MATDYISRQGLRERLGIDPDGDCEKCRYRGAFWCNQSNEHLRACEAIDDEPAADVVEVVRCGECRERTSGRPFCQGRPKDWFCANGARWTK